MWCKLFRCVTTPFGTRNHEWCCASRLEAEALEQLSVRCPALAQALKLPEPAQAMAQEKARALCLDQAQELEKPHLPRGAPEKFWL